MNARSAVRLLDNGKKIRHKTWLPGRYIHLDNGLIVNRHGAVEIMVIRDMHGDLWEEYKEPNKVVKGVEACHEALASGQYKHAIRKLKEGMEASTDEVVILDSWNTLRFENGNDVVFVKPLNIDAEYELVPKED